MPTVLILTAFPMIRQPQQELTLLDLRRRFGKPVLGLSTGSDHVKCHFSDPVSSQDLLSFPLSGPDALRACPILARYIAAEINNLVVTRGAQIHTIHAPPLLVQQIRHEMELRFQQLQQLTAVLDGSGIPRSGRPARSPSGNAWSRIPPTISTKSVAGVNVGQTLIKGYAWDSQTGNEKRLIQPLLSGCGTKADRIRANTERLLRDLLLHQQSPASALGLSVGGMVRDGRILPQSGITQDLRGEDLRALLDLPTHLKVTLGRLVFLEQDVRAKAFYHSAQGKKNCLILDVGTSLGGSYIDDTGCIPEYLNQVGRIAWDLSDSARQRSDGMGRGLLSDHLSAKGVLAIAHAIGIPISEPRDLENGLRIRLPHFLATAEIFTRQFANILNLLSSYYPSKEILLTGGVISGQLGLLLFQSLQPAELPQLTVTRSLEPSLDSALGVGWAAADHAEKYTSAPEPTH